MDKESITREQLYELVWEKPIAKLAKELKIDATELRKHCQQYEIPLPPSGYWSKLKFGKTVNKTPLSELSQKECSNTTQNDIKVNVDDYRIPFIDRLNFITREIESDKSLPLANPRSLKNPHKIIQRTKAYYQSLDNQNSRREENSDEGVIEINVSKGSMTRALLIMDYFIKFVIARGHEISVRHGRPETKIFTAYENFSIREKYNVTRFDKYPYTRKEATGILVFKAKSCYHKTWEDSKSKKLEEKIPLIVAWFETRARDLIAHWDESARREQLELERKQKEQEIKERKDEEIKKFKDLLDESERWYKTKILREYIAYIETNNISIHTNIAEWLKWAKEKADWYDPLINAEDEILRYFESTSYF